MAYEVKITSHNGAVNTVRIMASNLDELYETMQWNYPNHRIIGADAIQRIA